MKGNADEVLTMRRGAVLAVLVAVGGALTVPTRALAVTPVSGTPASATQYSINVSTSVDAYDPHVNADLAAYTADSSIHYYSFFSGTDNAIPAGSGSTDLLSDVDGGRIVFTRDDGSGARVMVFDTASATTTAISPSGSRHFQAAIGTNTVAFIDETIGVLNAAIIGSSLAPVTDGTRADQNPAVSPNGDRIVYESCPTSDPLDCDIHQAIWSGSGFVPSIVTSNALSEADPDTDGTTIVYDAVRTDARDVCWVSVAGGAESCLEIPGVQRFPSVSAAVIVFESASTAGAPADIYVYDTSSNRLYQITSTPANDSLSDVDVVGAGTVRVVWAIEASTNHDIYGADLELPPVAPTYSFGGFRQPVDSLPTLNSMKAGAAVPVKFSLGGDQGLDVFQSGYPKSQAIGCDSTALVDGIEQTVAAGGSALSYDPVSETYSYVWKTDKAWAGTCRQLILAFGDGTVARANFKLK